MINKNNLKKEFKILTTPKERDVFSAINIGNSKNKLGKDFEGKPLILFKIEGGLGGGIDMNLRNISVIYNQECTLKMGAKIENGTFTIIRFKGIDKTLQETFLEINSFIFKKIKNKIFSSNEVKESIKKIIDLFESLSQKGRKSIQGLWAELLVILLGKDCKKMISAWHSNPTGRFDFSFDKKELEVKSTSTGKREHLFSMNQLERFNDLEILFCSIFVEKMDKGKSAMDLTLEIVKKLKGDLDLIEKLYLMIYATMGESYEHLFNFKFNFNIAKSSLKIYDILDLPNLSKENFPPELIDATFKIKLDNIKDREFEFL